MEEPKNNLEFANRCIFCILQKKRCHGCPPCISKKERCTHITPKAYICEKCKKSKNFCLFQCTKCYKSNKSVEKGQPLPWCNDCKIATEDPPVRLETIEKDGKVYLRPIDHNNNEYEVDDEIFEKILELKKKNGYDLVRHFPEYSITENNFPHISGALANSIVSNEPLRRHFSEYAVTENGFSHVSNVSNAPANYITHELFNMNHIAP
ncbi:3756_t:CDS:2 [Acaulospora morrowiae]|uniref:3756_t:CDS:1 n=1 Tax=Acaulospora morrowiae TaxID=94023 RepID=A0A9N8ZLQ8_9GLOM|nr:3756_t:CDS:2 [Acaulospora morrowiae]